MKVMAAPGVEPQELEQPWLKISEPRWYLTMLGNKLRASLLPNPKHAGEQTPKVMYFLSNDKIDIRYIAWRGVNVAVHDNPRGTTVLNHST